MNLTQRIEALAAFGNHLDTISQSEKESIFRKAYVHNPWFTLPNIDYALASIRQMLSLGGLERWVSAYDLEKIDGKQERKTVGVVMAGNIPFVGFHDMLSILVSGHTFWGKPSQKDTILMQFLIKSLIEVEPQFGGQLSLRPQLKGADAYIATGSNNTARYFEYYFGKYPHVIRKNRSSVGVLNGQESQEALEQLADDVFQYFGLGCRNISKLYVPQDYDFGKLLDTFYIKYQHLKEHNKYANNYDYHKAIFLMEQISHLDAFNVLITPNEGISSPTSVVYYQTYKDERDLQDVLDQHLEEIQVIASNQAWLENSIPFGTAQKPHLTDYADGIDTLEFLSNL